MFTRKSIIISSVLIALIGLFGFFYFQKQNNFSQKSEKLTKLENYLNIGAPEAYSGQINNFGKEVVEYHDSLNAGDFDNAIKVSDKIISNVEKNTSIDQEEKNIRKIAAKYLKVNALVNYGNYFYKEKEYAGRADRELQEIQKIDVDLFDSPYGMYYVGYTQEIQKEYDKALEYYTLGVKYAGEDKYPLSILNNQIGHVYDLKGDLDKAYDFYIKAYDFDNKNYMASLNIGRSLYRTGKYKDSVKYFEYGLNSTNHSLRSEIYYSLSSIILEIGELKPDIEKSIEYARNSIESYPSYPMGYMALARGLYMKNDIRFSKEIEDNLARSIKLYPNGYEAYKIFALHQFDSGDLKGSMAALEKSIFNIDKDILLMNNDRAIMRNELKYTMVLLGLTNVAKRDLSVTMDIVGKKFISIDFGKKFIKTQITRVDHGVFKTMPGINEYVASFR